MTRQRGNGFSLVEILLALTIGAIVIAGTFEAFNLIHKWWVAASVRSEERQNARAGLETVTRDLEMAGYQTTDYGDPNNKTGVAITFASAHEIEVDQQRVAHTSGTVDWANPHYEPRLVYYHLATDMRTGRQHLYRQIRTQPGLPTPDEIVAENVSEFALAYFDKADAPVDGLPPANSSGSARYTAGTAVPATSPLRAIRRIQVTLTTVASREAPIGRDAKPFTLTASVMPQNLDVTNEVPWDSTPPAPPSGPTILSAGPPVVSGPAVIDTCTCRAKLKVKWNANTESDLAGYTVYYGPTNRRVIPVSALADKSLPEITLNPEDLLITKYADRFTASKPNTYAIQIDAYDSSGNHSEKSAAVSGNPSPDVTVFTASPFSNDTTVNPCKPTVPTGLTVVPGAAAGELVISWVPPVNDSATAGYRLYRSTAAFGTGHVNGSLQLRDEATLTSAVTTFTDKNRESCITYHYAVASINCDETLVDHLPYTVAGGDYAVNSGEWRDATLPPAPSLAGTLPEQQRILITLTNPLEAACADFDRTEIFWSKEPTPAPHLDGTVVLNGAPLPVRESAGGNLGTFRMRGSQVIDFDREAEAGPASSLVAGDTYNILAVSYDRCGNVSAPASTAAPLTIPGPGSCTDNPTGPPSDFFSNGTIAYCPPGNTVLGWQYPDQVAVPDLAGFRIRRSDRADELTSGPTLLTSWADTDLLAEGATFTYTVTATDCAWEEYLRGLQLQPYLDSLSTLTLGPVSPGELRRYVPPTGGNELAAANFVTTVSDVPTAHTYHNNVKFSLQNTSQSPVTIKRMAVSWSNPNVVLDSVVIGGSPSETPAETISVGGVASGAGFSVNTLFRDHADIGGNPSGPVPVLLRFTTSNGSVNRFADMRNDTLELSLWVGDHAPVEAECLTPTAITVDVPRGPVLGGFSQSAPGRYGIDSYEVVGASGSARDTDMQVPYGIPVNVYGVAFDNSRELFADGVNRGFVTLEVVGITAAAAASGVTPAMPTSGTFFHLPLQGGDGDRYTIYRTPPGTGDALMPGVSDMVVWYYALAVDKTGNWDRVPAPDSGNYAYYQPPFDVCTVSPAPPILTLASSSGTGALLTWTVPTVYDNGIAIVAADPLTYDVYVKSVGDGPWPSVPTAANIAGTSFNHVANLLTGSYYYMVRAKNSCLTGARSSGNSNVVAECEAGSNLDCSLFSVPATARYGDPILLAVNGFCTFKDNNVTDSVVFRVTSGTTTTDFTALETGDSGTFAKTITAGWSGGGGGAVAAPSGTLSVNLVVGGTTPCAAKTVELTGGACFTTPNPPTTFSAVRGASGSAAAVLTWVKPNYNTDGSALTDLAGYEIGMARCSVFNAGTGNCTTWSDWTISSLNDPAAQAYTFPNLVILERYKFRLRAKDRCETPVYSTWTSESLVVRVR